MNPNFVEAYSNRGMAYLRLGLPARAMVDLDRAVDLNPALPRLYRNRGKVLESLGRNEEARVDFGNAEELEKRQNEGKKISNEGEQGKERDLIDNGK
jgi:Flp pilus assembly protein TadD